MLVAGCLIWDVRCLFIGLRFVDINGVNFIAALSGFLHRSEPYSKSFSFSHEMKSESGGPLVSKIPSIDCRLSLRFFLG